MTTVPWPVLLALATAHSIVFAQPPATTGKPPLTANAIMARVAANQDLADGERSNYVYIQHAHVVSRKGQVVMGEEVTDSRVVPSASGSHAELLKLDGRLRREHTYVAYTNLPPTKPASQVQVDRDSINIEIGDTDRDLVETMRSGLSDDTSRDGIGAHLFPLTSKSQSGYVFRLLGRERLNRRDVFRIEFHPKEKDEFAWKGEAYIDATAYQPVIVTTAMARKIPFAVRTLLGTSLPDLGFSVVYAPQPDGVWFPVSFGTEFRVHVLFFFNREVTIDARNLDFEKTHVDSKIVASETPGQPQ